MTDINKKLEGIDEKLEILTLKTKITDLENHPNHPNHPNHSTDDEIDLRELWNVIWAGKFKIIAITAVFAIASVLYALSLPNMYKSEIILAPAQTEGKGGLGGLAAQYGGLAAMAGINLGGGDSSRIDQAVQLVKSWPFLESFINKHNLKPQIIAAEGWDKASNQIIYNTDLYNPETNQWDTSAFDGKPEPTSWQAYQALNNMLNVSNDAKTGMLNISVEHYSANIAFEWVSLIKEEINQFYQQLDMQEANKNIEYLTAKIAETNITEMQAVFYSMIESQTKTLMLAEVSNEYLVKTIVPAMVAELKSKPKRGLICVLGGMLGGVFSLMLVIILHYIKNSKNRAN